MRIAQLSDIHLDIEETHPHDVDVWGNLNWALRSAQEEAVDLFLLTGDLALREGSKEIYTGVARILSETGVPYLLIPGNHDDRLLFGAAFGRRYTRAKSIPLDLVAEVSGSPMYLLDSSNGYLGGDQIAWLDMRLHAHRSAAQRGEYSATVLLWTHHPILTGFHRYMDINYRLTSADELIEVLKQYSDVLDINVFCGHYHVADERSEHGLIQFTCPSTYVQIDPASEEFRVLSTVPAYRLVELDTNGGVSTRIVSRREAAT